MSIPSIPVSMFYYGKNFISLHVGWRISLLKHIPYINVRDPKKRFASSIIAFGRLFFLLFRRSRFRNGIILYVHLSVTTSKLFSAAFKTSSYTSHVVCLNGFFYRVYNVFQRLGTVLGVFWCKKIVRRTP